MQSTGGDADQDIARRDCCGIDNFLFLQSADDKTGEVVFSFGKITRMLGGFAADQRTTGLAAAGGDAEHHRFGDFHVELAADEVVEKKSGVAPWVKISLTPIATKSIPIVS